MCILFVSLLVTGSNRPNSSSTMTEYNPSNLFVTGMGLECYLITFGRILFSHCDLLHFQKNIE